MASSQPLIDAEIDATEEAKPFKSNSKYVAPDSNSGQASDKLLGLLEDAQLARERRLIYWSIFCLNIGVQWPYQSIIQAQAYYAKRFPDVNLEFLILIVSTWPLLVSHTIQVTTGVADRWGFSPRILGAFFVFQVMAGLVIIQDLVGMSEWAHIGLILMSGTILATAQSFSEPPLYAIAGVFPDGSATQAMQAGNGLTGVIVIMVNILARVAVGGGSSETDLRNAMYLFFGVQILYTCFCYLIYIRLRKLPTCIRYIAEARNQLSGGAATTAVVASASSPAVHAETSLMSPASAAPPSYNGANHDSSSANAPSSTPRHHDSINCMDRLRELFGVAKELKYMGSSQFYIFFLTLMLWPTIPCGVQLAGTVYNGSLNSWYCAPIIIGIFNCGDLVSRIVAGSEWGLKLATATEANGGMSQITMCLWSLARSVFIPLIILCATQPNPMIPGAASLVIFFVAVLAVTNGFFGSLTMMRGPLLVEPARREHASYVMVFFLYLGLALGALVSYGIGSAMNLLGS